MKFTESTKKEFVETLDLEKSLLMQASCEIDWLVDSFAWGGETEDGGFLTQEEKETLIELGKEIALIEEKFSKIAQGIQERNKGM